jgi:hypothetical protein
LGGILKLMEIPLTISYFYSSYNSILPLSNPLKYNDPTGHSTPMDEGDFYYQQLCEANGIDPDAGFALFT